jgi:hypothetical protein
MGIRPAAASVDQPHPPVHARRQFDVVGDHDQAGLVFAVEFAHQVEHRVGGVTIEVAGRLVGEDARRLGDQRARNGDALTFTAGKLAGAVVETMSEAHFFKNRGGARHRFRTRHAADQERAWRRFPAR